MKKTTVVVRIALSSLALVAGSWLQAGDRMKSGQWEVTSTDGGQTRTNTHCDTPEQVKAANGNSEEIRTSLEKSARSLHCSLQDFKMESDTISYTYNCPGRSTASKTSYHGNSYESMVTSKTGGEEHTRQVKGRRLGECPVL